MFFEIFKKFFHRSSKLNRASWSRRALLCCEGLEDRWVPASASQTGATLEVDFTADDEVITIIQTADTTYEVLDDGVPINTFTGVNTITVDGNGHDDITLELDGSVDVDDRLPGSMSIEQDGGNNFLIRDDNPAGSGASGFGVLGAFSVNNNTSDTLTIEFNDGAHVFGPFSVDDGDADSTIDVGAMAASRTTVNGFTSFSLGEGDGFTEIENMTLNGFASFVSEGGDDSTLIDDALVLGEAGYDLGSGSNVVELLDAKILGNVFGFEGEYSTIDINSADITGFVSFINNGSDDLTVNIDDSGDGPTQIGLFTSFISGDGDDQVTIDGSAGLGVSLFDNTGVSLGEGDNSFVLNTVQAGVNVFAYDSNTLGPDGRTPVPNFDLTGGMSTFTIMNSDVGGFASVVNNSDFDLTATIDTNDIGAFFSVISGGSNDTVIVDATQVAGGIDQTTGDLVSLEYALGEGDDTVSHNDSSFVGDVIMNTGSGNDTVTLESEDTDTNTLYVGMIDILMAEGDDTLTFGIEDDDRSVLFQDADVDGGSGSNELNDDNVLLLPGASINASNF